MKVKRSRNVKNTCFMKTMLNRMECLLRKKCLKLQTKTRQINLLRLLEITNRDTKTASYIFTSINFH